MAVARPLCARLAPCPRRRALARSRLLPVLALAARRMVAALPVAALPVMLWLAGAARPRDATRGRPLPSRPPPSATQTARSSIASAVAVEVIDGPSEGIARVWRLLSGLAAQSLVRAGEGIFPHLALHLRHPARLVGRTSVGGSVSRRAHPVGRSRMGAAATYPCEPALPLYLTRHRPEKASTTRSRGGGLARVLLSATGVNATLASRRRRRRRHCRGVS